jgi:sigma-B regulation protein RsbU (phosphoserine phosphatase)
MSHNVYHTSDPEKLLELKRLEADALLDILRTINQAGLEVPQLCTITRNLLMAQLGVRKILFYYESPEGWAEGIRAGFKPLPAGAREELREIRALTRVEAAACPELSACGIEYVVPIVQRDQSLAFFAVSEFADSEIEARSDLIFIETLGHILAVAIRNRELFREKLEQESLRRELEVAEIIQRQLLISDFSAFACVDVYGLSKPHSQVGGDFYDVVPKDDGSIFLCIADVAGKGIGAALLMSNLQANLRALCARYQEPEPIVRELNRILFSITTGDKFVTLFLAHADFRTQRLTYVNAGHNYPIFLRGEESLRLDAGCMLLGILPDLMVQTGTLLFEAGDILLLFTDGVVEQANAADEMFGSERVAEALARLRPRPARELVLALHEALRRFAGPVPPVDDATLLGVKFLSQS